MSPVPIIGLLILLLLLAFGIPLAFSMFLVGFFGLVIINGFYPTLALVGSTMYHSVFSFLYIVIPMFILMGEFANESGIVADLYDFFKAWVGKLSGALAIVTILTATMFSFATGSSIATTAVVGKLSLPEMRKSGYDTKLTLGCVVAGGTLGNLIPPSISIVIFGMITNESIGDLLIGGIVPGLLTSSLFILWIVLITHFKKELAPTTVIRYSTIEKIRNSKKVIPMLAVISFLFGSIYLGIATVTEAATVGCFCTFVIGLWKRKLGKGKIYQAVSNTVMVTGMVFILFATIQVFGRFLNFSGFTRSLMVIATESGLHPWAIMVFIYVILTILGCLVDPASILLLTVPICFPIIKKLGFDPIWFGIITVMWTQVGFLTPPVGMCVFVLKGISGESLDTCFRSVVYPLICWCIAIALVSLFPSIITWLPNLMR